MEVTKGTVFTRPWVVCLLALVCTLLWGSALPCIKIGYQMFHIGNGDAGSQILFAGYRFTLAGVMTWILCSLGTRKFAVPKKQIWGKVAVLGLIQTTIQYVFFYLGMANTTGVKGSIITATNTFFCILLAHFLIKNEKITIRKGAGCFCGLLGVLIINLSTSGFGGGFALAGEGFVLISCISYGLASVYIKSFAKQDNAVTITAYQLLTGGIVLIGIGLAAGGNVVGFTAGSTLLLLYMAMISCIAFSIWSLLLKYNSVGKVSIYGFTTPLFGMLLSSFVLGENAFTFRNLLALVCVSMGIVVVNVNCKGKKSQE